MDTRIRLGRYLIAAATIALGVQSAWLVIYVGRLQPIPDWVPGHDAIAYLTGAFLIVAGVGLLIDRWARLAAAALAAMLLAWVVLLYVPQLVANPFGGAWNGTAETFALFGGAWMLAATFLYASWALIVHIPRIMATPQDAFEWNGLFVAIALSGSAFVASRAR